MLLLSLIKAIRRVYKPCARRINLLIQPIRPLLLSPLTMLIIGFYRKLLILKEKIQKSIGVDLIKKACIIGADLT